MFLRILRLQGCSKDSHFSKGQEINTSDSGFKPPKDSHASVWLTSEVLTRENYKQDLVAIRIKFTNHSCCTYAGIPALTHSRSCHPPKSCQKDLQPTDSHLHILM